MIYFPSKAIHPGHVIARSLEREGMSQRNLSERTGLTEKHISQIINGEASVTVETALLLENALGGAASFWINLEKNFQETRARIERVALLRSEISLAQSFPYSELVRRGYLEQTSNKEKRVENLWKFFGVNSLTFIPQTEQVAYRRRPVHRQKSEWIAAWLRCGEIEARKIPVSEYSEGALKESLHRVRALTLQEPEIYSSKIKEILAESGVALVYVPHFPGTSVNGAVRWIAGVPVVQLSLLGSFADMFWFTLFHEVGHLLLHGRKDKFIEFEKESSIDGDKRAKEMAADSFAGRALIDDTQYTRFVSHGDFSASAVIAFAKDLTVHPGIIEGRLCHDKLIHWSKPLGFRTRLKFSV